MIAPIPAPGFRTISGKRNPPDKDGAKYWVQLALEEPGMGWLDTHGPWPVSGPKWKWRGDRPQPWEVVAVKRAA